MYDVADVQIEKVEEVLAPITDDTVSIVEGADEALRLSVLTIISSESIDTHGEYIPLFSTPHFFTFSLKSISQLLPFLFHGLQTTSIPRTRTRTRFHH